MTPRRGCLMFVLCLNACFVLSAAAQSVVRTADPVKRGMFVVTRDGVLLADAQGNPAATAYPSEWLATLTKAGQIDARIAIPGHGFTEDAAVSREHLRNYHEAMKAVIAEATRLHTAGVPVDAAIGQAHFGQYGSWTLARSQEPIAIRRVYAELDGELR